MKNNKLFDSALDTVACEIEKLESFINHKETSKRDACICLNCINFCQINYFSNMSKNATKGTEPVASKKEETKPAPEPAKGAKAPADAGKAPADQNKLGKSETNKAGDG